MASQIVSNGTTLRMSFKCGDSVRTSTSQYHAVYASASMTVDIATATTDHVIGLLESMQSAASEACTVITHGVGRGIMQTATSCVIGALLTPGATGTLDTAVTNTTEQVAIGTALSVPVTGGAVIVYVNPFHIGALV